MTYLERFDQLIAHLEAISDSDYNQAVGIPYDGPCCAIGHAMRVFYDPEPAPLYPSQVIWFAYTMGISMEEAAKIYTQTRDRKGAISALTVLRDQLGRK